MAGILFFFSFLGCGYIVAQRLFSQEDGLIRVWAGLVLGMMGLMWSPIPFSFIFGFNPLSHLMALLGVGAVTFWVRSYLPVTYRTLSFEKVPWPLIGTIVFFTIVIDVLLFFQMIYPRPDGLYAGTSTYGDLPYHLGIITNLAQEQVFPPENSVFAGARLTYHFLTNSLSSSLYMMGLSLRWSILLPSLFFGLMLVGGLVVFVREVLGRVGSTVLVTALFFLNGGFAFAFYLDLLRDNPTHLSWIFRGGASPSTLPDANIGMWNVITCLILPQRSTLGGWPIFFFLLWLLRRAMAHRQMKYFWIAGTINGLMFMVHAPSCLSFLLITIVWAITYSLLSPTERIPFKYFLPIIGMTVILLIPQIIVWAVPAVSKVKFSRFIFNGINEKDAWLWYWIKNGGIAFLLMIPALLAARAERLRFYGPALVLFLLAEFVVFAPWAADNNKIFFVWYLFTLILVAEYLSDIYARLKGLRGRWILLIFVFLFGTCSGLFAVIHEFRTSNRMASRSDLAIANFVRKKTPTDAVFLTAPMHNQPVAMLAGRKILCGHLGIMFSQGFDYGPRFEDMKVMYAQPELFPKLREKYRVDYVYISNLERGEFSVQEEYFKTNYPRIFSRKDVQIYAVSPRAQKKLWNPPG